jgi:hypothetical protein
MVSAPTATNAPAVVAPSVVPLARARSATIVHAGTATTRTIEQSARTCAVTSGANPTLIK